MAKKALVEKANRTPKFGVCASHARTRVHPRARTPTTTTNPLRTNAGRPQQQPPQLMQTRPSHLYHHTVLSVAMALAYCRATCRASRDGTG